ncbi:cation:proton antiporter [Pediococcus claussenii]|uniref:Sodium/hydrogen antiporter n=1 Tax=Pediococcus claussenii (strain ATCC BAA-344 / DSM 14800 / JCM 18046 / KCTC 3811 / LMG 21948 / P06) TaxID=701521 RepID=G8PF23_PEDCP|nr:sodium:proton antiporter [Pediococcus claussenii]AEV95702.1 sodium/hydrogen antiporter [Pediococcus claussenii ATCC BAA-344]ANZ69212.1 sodium:proton antiporter [Pediococcus claussenii]ANZ71031.1 sodium:proton antiporter [Pediococcus claussenii]KRN20065.1 hypothetical protein IV79_GL000729 [Pediococcus claussenii]
METVLFILVLIFSVVISNAVANSITIIPPAIIQILIGLVLSIIPTFQHFSLVPDIFMLAIIAPLMYSDGFETNVNNLRRNLSNTFSLSIGLAVTTIIIVGFLAHAMLPALPLALAFAIGAIITPTDAVAVSSLTRNLAVPESAMNSLKNESLFNDASGIVAFDLALLTFETGKFSAWFSVMDYIYVFFGGLLFGMIISFILVRIQLFLTEHQLDDPNVLVPLSLIVPFIVYLLAERLGTSGILAVVASGLVQSTQRRQLRLTSTRIQVVSTTTWSVLSSIMNGFVFILLGVTLPTVISDIILTNKQVASIAVLIGISLVLYTVMVMVRYLWVSLHFASLRIRPEDRKLNNAIIAINGIHGTITLAMAFSIPLMFRKTEFPYRSDLIFIAGCVIVISILVPTIILPMVLPRKSLSYSPDDVKFHVKEMVKYAINKVLEVEEDPIETQAVVATLQSQRKVNRTPKRREITRIYQECSDLENKQLQKLVDKGEISTKQQITYQRIMLAQSVHLGQTIIQNVWVRIKYTIFRFLHRWKHRSVKIPQNFTHEQFENMQNDLYKIEEQIAPVIFKHLKDIVNSRNSNTVGWLQRYYRERHRRFQNNVQNNEIQDELFINAFQQEYSYVQEQLSKGTISRELADVLYAQISNDELVYMQNDGIYS